MYLNYKLELMNIFVKEKYFMLTSKQIGIITEEQCKLYFIERGYTVSVPIGDNAPYDFVLEVNNTLYKIQVKHARVDVEGTFTVELVKNVSTRTQLRTSGYKASEVDYFCTMFEGICYLIPYGNFKYKVLRTSFPKTNQVANVSWATDYEADYIIEKLTNPECSPRIDMNFEYKQHLAGLDKQTQHNSQLGTRWITNGIKSKKLHTGDTMPEGYRLGRTL